MTSNVPKVTKDDHAHAAIRAALGAIPWVGSGAVEVFNAVVTPPIERRRDRWREQVGEDLKRLHECGVVDVATLCDNDTFANTIMSATAAAIKTHQEENRAALRNAILNASLPDAPDDAIQQIFVRNVDEFTTWHLRLLKLNQNPRRYIESLGKTPREYGMSSSLIMLVEDAMPELHAQRELLELIDDEINTRGLTTGGGLNTMMSANGAYEKRTTPFGDQFLRFIEEPSVLGEPSG